MRHRSPQFGHVFSSEGYSAGYYGYLWADVLTVGRRRGLRRGPGRLLRQGRWRKSWSTTCSPSRNAVDPAEAYRAFRGRDARSTR